MTKKSNSPFETQIEPWSATQSPPNAFQFLKTTTFDESGCSSPGWTMNSYRRRQGWLPWQLFVRWPVVGEIFVLTTPFIEPPRRFAPPLLRKEGSFGHQAVWV